MKVILLLIACSVFTYTGVESGNPPNNTIQVEEPNLFSRAVELIKEFEGMHTEKHYPYVGYGHKTRKGEVFTLPMKELVADSLLRVDLLQKCAVFRAFGKDSLLLGVLAYNVGEYTLLGWADKPKSSLIRKLESGNRNIYQEYISYRMYKGNIVKSLERRREKEYRLLYDK